MEQRKSPKKGRYHHGNLAESLLDAVDEIASQFGLEAVTLRACAKRVGVSPSSAFRHYTDKRALLTAFATRALHELCQAMTEATPENDPDQNPDNGEGESDAFTAVGLAYIRFAIDKPAFFRAMWREETIYSNDAQYQASADRLSAILKAGFADTLQDKDPMALSTEELLAWSSVHGLANLYVDGPVGHDKTREEKLQAAAKMIRALKPVFDTAAKLQIVSG